MPEEDPLAGLEERIRRTAELVTTLKAERDAAVAERDSARQAAGAALAETRELRQELEGLRSDRTQVRTRIEKLLGQMDLLSGS
jgi:FtsZ-binding cell division protein ZapB